jgi:SAM-dependent methyltransferase
MFRATKQRLRGLVPAGLAELWRRRKIAAIRARNRGRPAREIFREIYLENRWGGDAGTFNSGSGSTERHAHRYAAAVREFIRERAVRRVVDLGCGDFTVGAELLDSGIDYVGVDIVEEVVRVNERAHGSARVQFRCLDVAEDPLPSGDLCLIRQVLQHLSNEQIGRVLRNVERYRYVLVTEHYPAPGRETEPNRDKPCGEDVRVYDGSAVYLDLPPFDRRLAATVLDVDAGRWLVQPGERIRTVLLENAGVAI